MTSSGPTVRPAIRTISYSAPLSPDEEGCLAHLREVFKCDDKQIVDDALKFVFRCVRANVPMAGTLVGSLEEYAAHGRVNQARLGRTILTAEKALADCLAVTRAVEAMLASPTLPASAPTHDSDSTT